MMNRFRNREKWGFADLIRQTLGDQGCGILEATSYKIIIG